MSDSAGKTRRLLDEVAPYVALRPGLVGHPTPVPRVTVWASTRATAPTSAVFEPMFYAVLRGIKVLTVGANRFELPSGACAVSTLGLPYTHELTGATPESPYVGVSLHLDVNVLSRVVLDVPVRGGRWACAVAAGDLGGVIGETFARLVGLVSAPEDVGALAPHYESELYYRLLQSPMGDALRQIVPLDDRARSVRAAADRLAADPSEPVTVSELAASGGMSVTSFHRHFKAVTGFSPIAFQHRMRLLEARKLLASGVSVTDVAYRVGYGSPSQFSREYKNLFGNAPAADLRR